MANDADKLNYAKRLMNLATQLDDISYEIEEMNKIWDAKTYGSGGGDEILDTDIGTLPITATILQGMNYSLVHFINFLTNNSPAASDHRGNLAKGRNVEGEYTIVL
jgi:hypothetical protein